jgi:hypothetical protein
MEICHCMGMYNKKHAPFHAKIILSCCLTGIYINSYNTVLSTHHFNTCLHGKHWSQNSSLQPI